LVFGTNRKLLSRKTTARAKEELKIKKRAC
jgi:hypothetical protein